MWQAATPVLAVAKVESGGRALMMCRSKKDFPVPALPVKKILCLDRTALRTLFCSLDRGGAFCNVFRWSFLRGASFWMRGGWRGRVKCQSSNYSILFKKKSHIHETLLRNLPLYVKVVPFFNMKCITSRSYL